MIIFHSLTERKEEENQISELEKQIEVTSIHGHMMTIPVTSSLHQYRCWEPSWKPVKEKLLSWRRG